MYNYKGHELMVAFYLKIKNTEIKFIVFESNNYFIVNRIIIFDYSDPTNIDLVFKI